MNWDASMDSSPGGIGNAGFAPITGGPVSKIERRKITNDMQPSFFYSTPKTIISQNIYMWLSEAVYPETRCIGWLQGGALPYHLPKTFSFE